MPTLSILINSSDPKFKENAGHHRALVLYIKAGIDKLYQYYCAEGPQE